MSITVSTARPTYALFGLGGAAQIPYLIKILEENYKRYRQLQEMISMAKDQRDFQRILNSGIDNIDGLISVFPIQDQKILEELKSFQDAVNRVQVLYGKVPISTEAALQNLHDQTVAESLKLMNDSKIYASEQEKNANRIIAETRGASPKGAMRITAQTNAEILHTLNQLLKINGQMLKLQSEQLALKNKDEKDSVRHFQRVRSDVKSSSKNYQANLDFPKF